MALYFSILNTRLFRPQKQEKQAYKLLVMKIPSSAVFVLLIALLIRPYQSFPVRKTAPAARLLIPVHNNLSPLEASSNNNSNNDDVNGETTKSSRRPTSKSTSEPDNDETKNYNFIGLNTNQNAPYIPSGLTSEQYQKIRLDEAEKQAKMNFAAWGPRFKRSDAPRGDWMVQTDLWTQGFAYSSNKNNNKSNNGNKSSNQLQQQQQQRRRRQRQQELVAYMRTGIISFVLAYLVLDIVLLPAPNMKSGFMMVIPELRRYLTRYLVLRKFQLLVQLVLAGVATPFVNQYRDLATRRWLWSRRQVYGAPVLAALGLLLLRCMLKATMKAIRVL